MGAFTDFGRKFLNSLPGAGGVLSSLWGDPSQEAHQRSFEEAQRMMREQRSNMMDARMNAMGQGALAFGPRNQMLGQMMGQEGPAMDLNPMLQNPMPQNMQTDIRTAAFGAAPPPNAPPGMGGGQAKVGGAFTGVGPQNPYRRY